MVDSLGDLKQEIRDLMRRIRVLESASPLGYSSITEGALEIRSEEGLIVIGSLRISGVMNGDGTITWTGPWNLTGLGTVTGDVAWSGDLNLTGNITVLPGGKIQVGDMIIDPAGGGSVTFPDGAAVRADVNGGITMVRGDHQVYVGGARVMMQYGSKSWGISALGHEIVDADTIKSSDANGAPAGCLWTAASRVYRVIPD
jgi:hypothetical protein